MNALILYKLKINTTMKTDYITNLETLRGAMRESSMLTALAMLAITGDQKPHVNI